MATEVARMTAQAEGNRPGDDRPEDTRYRAARRKAARYAVPAAVVGVTALTVGLVPALADSGDPDLPELTAHQLVAKLAGAHEEHFSGTVRVSTDLGLPGLDGAGIAGLGGAAKGSGGGADPQAKLTELASGTHTLRLAADGPERQRLSILEDAAEYSIIRDGARAWAYDSASDKAVRLEVPRSGQHEERSPYTALTPQELADQALKAVDAHTTVRADGTARVAGRDAYQLVVEPKQSGSTVKAVRVLVDAKTGTPLRAALTARDGGKPVVEAGFTKVSFTAPKAKTFSFTPPKGTEVTEPKQQAPADRSAAPDAGALKDLLGGSRTYGEGWTTVARLDLPGEAAAGLSSGDAGQAGKLMDSLAKEVKGSFGTGRLFSTRLVNVLLTEDGHVYAGAVTKDTLVKAAESHT
ncbi:sigma-E factor regulatory protein RseB domain-containing protein [Streptomyces sp. SID11385]|uniref:LolA family protein n=1 Tax=Streptomyces sp. SID11385 TaxID=2706031 RepID=UPI0013CB836C|nr:sigma-E factor regulatory protein RseB domain-containing protein [Streptomyces sp. SID11385]NEA39561.1 DUF2092 domain-containing protein [Streptomyces sp. SID11385]